METEKEADRILQEAREKAARIIASADDESAGKLRDIREEGRFHVREEMRRIDESEAERLEQSLSEEESSGRFDKDLVESLARAVAERITTTVFDLMP